MAVRIVIAITISEESLRLAITRPSPKRRLHCPNFPSIALHVECKHWVDGNSIIRFRQHFNFTQLELSVLLGVHSVTISRWENGKIGIGNKIQCAILRLNKKSDDAVRHELSVKKAAYLAQ